MQELIKHTDKNIIESIIILIIGLIIYSILKKAINRIAKKNEKNKMVSKRRRTYIRLFNSILKYILVILFIVIILQINGVNISSLVTGLGIASVIVGLALQDALKDIIMGFNIVIDNYFSVGDVLKIGDIEGKVISFGLKSTKLKDIYTQNFYVIANRNIDKALNISKQMDIDIPIPYEEKVERIEEIIENILEQVRQINGIIEATYKGVNEFADSAIYYKIRMFCEPELKPQLKRDINRIIKVELDRNNIAIPYKQIDIHTKK